jgi:hypothetical protein
MNQIDQYTMQDPIGQYPAQDIPDQTQAEPGLDAKLQPQADHGELSYKGLGRLKGRKAVITGADSGIGRAVAIAYAREGADIVLNYLPAEEVDALETVRLCAEAGVRVERYAGDISNEAFCQELIKTAADTLGSIDILVNNASKMTHVAQLDNLDSDQLVKTFSVNVFAIFWLTKAALQHMPKGASVINTTSIQAYRPSPALLDYAATKGAVSTLTHALGKQLAERGIRVNAVAPGPIWTPIQVTGEQPKGRLQNLGKDTPYKRMGQPAEVAPLFVFLASQESSYITGEVMGVTGGHHTP